jgi:hypothetical protein
MRVVNLFKFSKLVQKIRTKNSCLDKGKAVTSILITTLG